MNAETLARAYEILCHRRLAGHEAAHAAAALLLGLRVSKVTAPYWRLEDVEDCNDDGVAGFALIERPTDDDGRRKMAVATIAGKLEDGRGGWPPAWPLSLAPEHGDEADLCQLVEELNLDAKGYRQLVHDAYDLVVSRPYTRLHAGLSYALEEWHTLDEATLTRIKQISEGHNMEHLTLKAVTTATDQGTFEAVISTENVDREKDIVSATGLVAALRKWNRPIPLA